LVDNCQILIVILRFLRELAPTVRTQIRENKLLKLKKNNATNGEETNDNQQKI
jgi:hypothetical protein